MRSVKILITTIIAIITMFSQVTAVSAFALQTTSDVRLEENIAVFRIYAKPTAKDQNAVSIWLKSQDIQIVNFVVNEAASWLSVIPECNGSKLFNENEVCVSMAKTTPIKSDEILGDITIKFNDNNDTTTLKIDTNSGYASPKTFVGLEETEFKIKLLESDQGQQNQPNHNNATFNLLIILLGLAIVIMLILAFFSSFRNRVF